MKRRVGDAGDPTSVRWRLFGGDVVLDACNPCRGIWFDGGELAELLGRNAGNLPTSSDESAYYLRCPSCGEDARDGDRSCPECGKSLLSTCPRCRESLGSCSFEGTTLLFCERCAGVWIEDTLLDSLSRLRETIDSEMMIPPKSKAKADTTPVPTPATVQPEPSPPPETEPTPEPPPPPTGDLTCAICGKQELTNRNTMITAHGTVCDPCGITLERQEMRDWKAADRSGIETYATGEDEWASRLVGNDLSTALGELFDILSPPKSW